ncbi:MAG TPA: hypothetical protein VGJ36_09750 [Gemmatimonadales bacterium]|jgi:hypothetical protein
MPGAAYTPGSKIQIHVISQSPHTFAHKLWFAKAGDTEWRPLDEGNIETPEREYGPYPAGTKIAYALLIGGNPNTDWKMQVMMSQQGALLNCSPPPETGITNSAGVARRDTAVALN